MKRILLNKKKFFNWIALIIFLNLFLISCANDTLSNDGFNEEFVPRNDTMESCYGDYYIQDQSDLDSLQRRGCTEITGDLVVRFSSLNHLQGLESLNSIQGDLRVNKNSSLRNLSGLNNVNYIGGDLILKDNSLRTMIDIGNVSTLGGNLHIESNANLATCQIRSFKNHLDKSGWRGDFFQNFNNNKKTCENICWGSYTVREQEDKLELSGCEVITGSLNIMDSSAIVNMYAFRKLRSIVGNFVLYNNAELNDLSSLSTLDRIVGSLIIKSNPGIVDLNDFSGLKVIYGRTVRNIDADFLYNDGRKGLSLQENASLKSVSGLNNLNIEDGDVFIISNQNLSTDDAKDLVDHLRSNNWDGDYVIQGNSNPNELTVSLSANPSEIDKGDSTTLYWYGKNATYYSIDNGIGTVYGNSITVSPQVSTTYTITAYGPGGTATSSATVTVRETDVPTVNISVNPSSIETGNVATLSWTSSNATYLWINNGIGSVKNNSSIPVYPDVTTTYTITAVGPGGTSTDSVTLYVNQVFEEPTVNISASPILINPGGTSTLSWTATNATSLSINNGIGAVSGSSITVNPTVTTTYTITATGPGGTATNSVTVIVRQLPTVKISANPSTINQGEVSTLSWIATNATSLSINNGIGTVTGNSRIVNPTVTTTYIITASGPGGTVTDSVTVTVRQVPTVNISANPAVINKGEVSTLSWTATNAVSFSIDNGIGIVPGNSRIVNPTETTTYTITATGPGGTATDSVTVTVRQLPTVNISANPAIIKKGEVSTLSWTASNATSLSINNGIGAVSGNSITVNPTVTTTYIIKATGPSGTATDSVTVTVRQLPSVIISANPAVINKGEVSTLSWTATNATSFSINNGIGTVSGNSKMVNPTVTTTYVITATGPGGTATDSVTVTVRQLPVVVISANPTVINQGEVSTLNWIATNATSLSIDNGIGAVNGNLITVNPTETTTYTITATGPGGVATDSITITVRMLPTVNISANPSVINKGGVSTLSWTAANATSLSINNGIGTVSGDSKMVNPTVTTTYIITATGPGGTATDSVTVTVRQLPTVNMSANPAVINQGEVSTLNWTATNTTSLSIDNGIGVVNGNSITVNPTETTTYTITAIGPGGTATNSVTVTVRELPTVNISANPAVIKKGEVSTLSWTATNATSLSINNGIGTVSGNSRIVNPAETTTYIITAIGPGGTATDSVTITVNKLPTVNITADPLNINEGTSTTLSWTSTDAVTFWIDNGIGFVKNNSLSVSPTKTTTYTITATGPGGSATDSVTITVRPLPTVSISLDPDMINVGESSTLFWTSTNTTSLWINNGIGFVKNKSITVNPTKTTTYTIVGSGPGGNAIASVTLYVNQTPIEPTVNISANPSLINEGEMTILSWTSNNATGLIIDNGIGTVLGNSIEVAPTVTTTYTIIASGLGGTATDSVTVYVNQVINEPTVNISANPMVITEGESSILSWMSTDAVNLSIDNGIGSVTGNSRSVSPTETTTYIITATGPGGTATDSVTVYVNPLPDGPTVSISANPMVINAGESSVLTWTSTNATTLSINNGIGIVSGSSITVTPAATTTYTITANGPNGTATDSVTVSINSGPQQTVPFARWAFEEGQGNSIADSSGNGHNGTFIGNPEWVEGVVGNYSLDINENSGYVEVASTGAANDFYHQRFTISTWLTSANGIAVAAYLRLPGSWQVITEDNELKFVYYNAEGQMIRVEPGYTFPASEEWHHYAITVDVSVGEVHFYVDGVELQGAYQIDNLASPSANEALLIGQFANDYRWNGLIDDVRFYDTVLDSSEIYSISQNTDAVALQPGINEMTLEHDGQARNYAIHVPANYNGYQSYPVVVCLHPRNQNRDYFYTSMAEVVNNDNVIGVYPQGINNSWNTGYGYEPSNANDVEFVEMVLGQVRSMANVDTTRIFALGISNGGGLAYRLVMDSTSFTAMASVMYSMYENQTIPASTMPLSVLQINGTADASVPFDGGIGGMNIPFESALSTTRMWGMHNNGVYQPQMNFQPGYASYGFPGEREVVLYEIYNQAHLVPETIDGIDFYSFVWQFFNRNSR